MALTDKQKLFAYEYLIDLSANRAYEIVYKNYEKIKLLRFYFYKKSKNLEQVLEDCMAMFPELRG